MIGNSVVPGLPNRCVMPSSLSNARNAERPVMRFMKVLPCPRPLPSGSGHNMADVAGGDQGRAVMAALHRWAPSSCPGRGAALLQPCTAEAGPALTTMGPGSAARHFAPHYSAGAQARVAQAWLEHSLEFNAFFPFRALPDHTGKTFQRH